VPLASRPASSEGSGASGAPATGRPLREGGPIQPAGRPPTVRQWNWDRLRILSFLDIASFHMSGQYLLLGTGLPIFLLLRFALASRLPTPEPTGTFIRVRVEKLLVPWAAWSLVFGALGLAIGLRHGIPVREMVDPYMLLYGPSVHLWFLPFAAVVGMAVHFIDVATQKVPSRPFLVACALAGVAALWLAQASIENLQTPFRQWTFGLPAVPLGLGLGRILARPWPDVRRVWGMVLLAGLAAVGFLLARRMPGSPFVDAPTRYALAVTMIAGGALLPNLPGRWTSRITPLLLGGYLLQEPLYSQTLARLERRTGVELAPVLLVLLMVPPTLLLVAALRRTRLRAIL
jgi:hypothetical protein